jgi:hypothetical protein
MSAVRSATARSWRGVRHSRCSWYCGGDPPIRSGQLIKVDGDAGTVTLRDGQDLPRPSKSEGLAASEDHRWGRRCSRCSWAHGVAVRRGKSRRNAG